jgi:hypothetical protein
MARPVSVPARGLEGFDGFATAAAPIVTGRGDGLPGGDRTR